MWGSKEETHGKRKGKLNITFLALLSWGPINSML